MGRTIPWLHDLSDEQIWKIWLMYDRAYDHNGGAESDQRVTTCDEAIELVGELLNDTIGAAQLEYFEEPLEFDEEYKLAHWMRKLRHERESEEEEQARYERDDELHSDLSRAGAA